MREGRSFKESRLYPVVFMLVLSAILTFILAFSYQISRDRVEIYRTASFRSSLLELLAADIVELQQQDIKLLKVEEINKIYQKYIVEKKLDNKTGQKYYLFTDHGKETGYVFPVSVKGLWSTIDLLAAVSPDFNQYIGIKVIAQQETPGLGARITEKWFQVQFIGKKIIENNKLDELKLVSENEKALDQQIRQITGATVSSRAVAVGVQQELQLIYKNYFLDGAGVNR